MGVKGILKRAAGKAADGVSKLSSLSPEQLDKVQSQRDEYLSQMPDPNDSTAEELTKRLLAASSVEIYKAYLAQLKELYVPIERQAEYGTDFDTARNIRFFNITKWVVDKSENSLEKLVNVYEVLSNEDCNISLVFHRTCEKTNVYLAVTNTQNANNNVASENFRIRLGDAIKGNFPGSEWAKEIGTGVLPCMKNDIPYSVAIASNVPTEKSEKFISQTIEKLLDGIVPDKRSKEYIIILLATPVRDIEHRKLSLAEMYSGLAPYASWSTTFTYNEQNSVGSSATVGVNIGASAGIQNGQNQANTTTSGITDSNSSTVTDSTSDAMSESTGETMTDSTGQSVTDTAGSSTTSTTGSSESTSATHTDGTSTSNTDTTGSSDTIGGTLGFDRGLKATANYGHTFNRSTASGTGTNMSDASTTGKTQNISESIATSTGKAIAASTGQAIAKATGTAVTSTVGKAVANTLGKALSNSISRTAGAFKSVNFGANFGANFARSSNVTVTIGKGEGINQTFTNYNIKHALEILEAQMKRLEQSTALGMWDFAAYVMSEDQNVSNNVAHSYLALTQGEESYMSQAAINLWRGDMGESSGDAKEICDYLRELRHPLFGLNPEITSENPDYNVYPPVVTATTNLSGKELAYSLNFPKKSISGLPVIECAEFGRNVVYYDLAPAMQEQIELGKIFHMNHEENAKVHLANQSLASHTFITGSTGSGKSNTIYGILDKLHGQNKTFLVIEPAKGEYKNVFGHYSDVSVYGTNPALNKLLRINPFSFPEGIHIYEHIDRLVEIFNACWPMYAAMPAVLKDAIERAYESAGWDLKLSKNRYNDKLFPGFVDVLHEIEAVMDESEYSSDSRGDYKGALCTRIRSLTNGINSLVFTSDELSTEELFDRNVIADLSRVGSMETKSLIMGILVMKLQEYRMTSSNGMNQPLNHVTVLEEAHNLLKRTSTEQNSEESNLIGKSVEMLTNAIAEMRTYGEGFIIADQAPGLLDMAVIRNTNTKIILRLPDFSDRQLVGRAAGLNDDQITELSKLPKGVAAVYQNDWIEAVLCKVEKYNGDEINFSPEADKLKSQDDIRHKIIAGIRNVFHVIDGVDDTVIRSEIPARAKIAIYKYLEAPMDYDSKIKATGELISALFECDKNFSEVGKVKGIEDQRQYLIDHIKPELSGYSEEEINQILTLLIVSRIDNPNSIAEKAFAAELIDRLGGKL